LVQGDRVTLGERIDEQSFCYDPDFPPEVPEGMPLAAARPEPHTGDAALRRALRACGHAAAAVKKRARV
jgi:hypothetical protein